ITNTLNNWTIAVGAAGTQVFKSSSGNAFDGLAALQITGDGSNLTALTQTFAAASGSGTTVKLKPLTAYALNGWLKMDTVPTAGVLRLALVDGSNVVINDAAGTANAVSKTLSAATTGYLPLSGVFRTPALLPSTQKLSISLTTALDT